MRHNIVIIGAGSIGRAVEHLIQDKNIQLELWDKDPSQLENPKELREIVPSADIIFLCVPSWSVREALELLKPNLIDETVIVSLSKGLEEGTNLRVDQIANEVLPRNPFVLLSGPMIARIIQEDKRSYACVASSDQTEAVQAVEQLFVGTKLTLEVSNDIASVALAGILKNVYAIILGVVDGCECGVNSKGWVVALAVREMQKIAERLQADPTVMLGTAGLADLIATGFSPSSNNHRVGRELVLHGRTDLKSEGIVSIAAIDALLDGNTESLPLFHLLKVAINHQPKATIIFDNWLKHKTSKAEAVNVRAD